MEAIVINRKNALQPFMEPSFAKPLYAHAAAIRLTLERNPTFVPFATTFSTAFHRVATCVCGMELRIIGASVVNGRALL
jgi:hypothetical protein